MSLKHALQAQTVARLAAVVGILLGLLLAGGHNATAGGTEQPAGVAAIAVAPGWVKVSWEYPPDNTVTGFVVQEQTLGASKLQDWTVRDYLAPNLQPKHTYYFRVCAVYGTGQVCSDYVRVDTPEAQPAGAYPCGDADEPIPAQPPFFTDHSSGDTWIDVTWHTNGHCYHSYHLNYEVKAAPGAPRNPVQDVKEGQGDWGGHRLEGLLPGTTYILSVEGCNRGDYYAITADNCLENWSPAIEVTTTGRKGDEWRTKWQQLDNNKLTAQIVADGDKLYQRWSSGEVWQYTGQPCQTEATSCTSWQQLDANHNTAQIAASGGHLYQRWSSGQIWQYTGTPCQAQGTSCTGWQKLGEPELGLADICADGDHLYDRWNDGTVREYQDYPGGVKLWRAIDTNANTAQIACGGGKLYQRWSGGQVWQYTGTPGSWTQLDRNQLTAEIVAGDQLY